MTTQADILKTIQNLEAVESYEALLTELTRAAALHSEAQKSAGENYPTAETERCEVEEMRLNDAAQVAAVELVEELQDAGIDARSVCGEGADFTIYLGEGTVSPSGVTQQVVIAGRYLLDGQS
jgi:hypothetical protein